MSTRSVPKLVFGRPEVGRPFHAVLGSFPQSRPVFAAYRAAVVRHFVFSLPLPFLFVCFRRYSFLWGRRLGSAAVESAREISSVFFLSF